MSDKPEFPTELLDGCISHIERLKADFNRVFGSKGIFNDAVISVDTGTVSYGHEELLVMRDNIVAMAKKNDEFEAARKRKAMRLILCAVSIHNDMNKRSNRPEQGVYSTD